MAISSLVLDLAPDHQGDAARASLGADPRFTVGPQLGTRHAVVVETASAIEDIDCYRYLQCLPGVRSLTLVRAYLDDETLPAGAAADYL